MAIRLKQSTASQEVPLGVFVDETDGKTAETGLTIANTDIKLWKMGATTLANKNSGGATHISGGIYYAVLDATDTNTLGGLVIFVHVAGALPVRVECEVLPANVYDSLVAGTDVLDVNTVQISDDATAANNAESFFDGTGYAGTNNVIPTVTTVTNAVSANMTQISGDTTAADNLEAMLDGTRAKLYLTQLSIVAAGNDSAVVATGAGTGHGIAATGGNTAGAGLKAQGGTDGIGLEAVAGSTASGSIPGIKGEGQGEGSGMYLLGGSTNGSGLEAEGVGTGYGVWAYGDGGSPGLFAQNDGTGPGIMDNTQSIEDMVWDATMADHIDAGSAGEALDGAGGAGGGGDITSVDGSTTAAENLRKMFDGTGYAATASSIGTVTNIVTANVTQLNSSANNAARLAMLVNGIVYGTAQAGTLSTTEMTTSLTESTDNHFKPPQVVKWVSGALIGQARAITGYVGATKKLQYQATTEAPTAGDLFVIL